MSNSYTRAVANEAKNGGDHSQFTENKTQCLRGEELRAREGGQSKPIDRLKISGENGSQKSSSEPSSPQLKDLTGPKTNRSPELAQGNLGKESKIMGAFDAKNKVER
jgi:hypothetical protein